MNYHTLIATILLTFFFFVACFLLGFWGVVLFVFLGGLFFCFLFFVFFFVSFIHFSMLTYHVLEFYFF